MGKAVGAKADMLGGVPVVQLLEQFGSIGIYGASVVGGSLVVFVS